MGANPTQAQGLVVFIVGFVLVAAGLASKGVFLSVGGLVVVALSLLILKRTKPWEHTEE